MDDLSDEENEAWADSLLIEESVVTECDHGYVVDAGLDEEEREQAVERAVRKARKNTLDGMSKDETEALIRKNADNIGDCQACEEILGDENE